MGRNIPTYHDYNHTYKDHPLLSVSFLIACIAATIAIVSALCGSLSRKKPPGAPVEDEISSPRNQKNDDPFPSPPPRCETTESAAAALEQEISNNKEEEEEESKRNPNPRQNGDVVGPLPPPPARSTSYHVRSHSTPMKLESSMSVRVATGPSAMRQGSRRSDNKKLKLEDSVWKKAIILGEKCRVPDEEDEAIVYDEKGRRISTYHPKTKSNALEILSRQNSGSVK